MGKDGKDNHHKDMKMRCHHSWIILCRPKAKVQITMLSYLTFSTIKLNTLQKHQTWQSKAKSMLIQTIKYYRRRKRVNMWLKIQKH
jgi:hypothetical protein